MAYTKTNWQDLPNQTTPINATNLNNIENGIKTNDDKLIGNTLIDNLRVKRIEGKNLLSPANIINGIYNVGQGIYIESNDACCTINPIEIDNAKNYVLSTENTQTSSNMYVMFYDSSMTYLGYISTFFSNVELKLNTFSNYSSAKYINFRFDKPMDQLINPQLEIGDSHTSFKPYQNFDGQEMYSKNEIEIGKWIDGKPLYRRVFDIPNTSINSSSTTVISFNISNHKIVNFGGYLHVGTSNYDYPINGFRALDYGVRSLSNGLQLLIGTSLSAESTASGKLIVEYTKTTD